MEVFYQDMDNGGLDYLLDFLQFCWLQLFCLLGMEVWILITMNF